MRRRVVITGMGVCAPNANNINEFAHALKIGKSGIKHHPELEELNFRCQIAGKPNIPEEHIKKYFTPLQLRDLKASGIVYGVISGVDAWKDAGLEIATDLAPDWDSGIIFGTGILGVDKFRDAIYKVDAKNVRRLGSTTVLQTMASGISAYLGGLLGCGNQVTTNSSACSTGTEGILMAYERIASGNAERILTGSCSDSGPYVWGGFDAMRILPRKYNENPEDASRPMSASASGFVPGSGAGALVLESLESAQKRNSKIYVEVLGGAVNCGGQRGGGTMTAPNSTAVKRCLKQAIAYAGVAKSEIDVINGHLTATSKDPVEIQNWQEVLGCSKEDFPYINSFKSLIGHCLAAAGSIECVGAILQFTEKMVFGNRNCVDLHPEILKMVSKEKIPIKSVVFDPEIMAKASFGFGDVNACVIFKKYKS
ncbi:beta-ketoacyl-[acyl-carrier-protein] synthase family protein [Ascidiimonas sp. W6]|uniref:beta-ketoacyl-[acyl-carrier-protein] synthase family protein n=1 Tax=Ascidiimonas meishanensis TaxID=3128903 RepID=UPI0030EB6131